METTYYRELSEECALQHGWRGEDQDGEAACFMYREILKRGNEISNLKIINGMYEENEIHHMQSCVSIGFGCLAFGLFLGWWLL
jgi:hypothetical protein